MKALKPDIPTRASLTYRCPHCGFECVAKRGLASGLPETKLGDYGANGTPAPTTFTTDEVYAFTAPAGVNAFTAASGSDLAYLYDPFQKVSTLRITGGDQIVVTTDSGTNDGTYTVYERGISLDRITLASGFDFTTEDGATAGEVSLAVVMYQPNVTTGCPFCGSLNTKKKRR